MNYGKNQASKKQNEITSKKNMTSKRVGVRAFKAFLLTILVICVIGAAGVGIFVKKMIDDAPQISPNKVRPNSFASVVLDQSGKELDKFVESGSNRIYKTIDEIPEYLQHAFVAVEDERFYEHNGIDLQGILRAGIIGITSGGNFSQGASTLTQQLIKNNVFPDFLHEKTFYDSLQRKVQEWYLSIKIEKQMDKKEIMENYLNTINLGQNTLGVQSASKRYFNKDVSELTLSECSVIASITQNPSGLNPITNPEDNAKRRSKVLNQMEEQGYISAEEKQAALDDDVYSRIQAVNLQVQGEASTPTTYFIDAIAVQAEQDLIDKLGYTDTQAHNAIYSGGLSIIATQDSAIQKICDEEISNDENYPGKIEYGLTYAVTIKRADGSTDNYDHNIIKNYMRNTYGDKYGLVFSTEDKGRATIEEWKASNLNEGDEVLAEVINFSPQPQATAVVIDQYTGYVKAISGCRGVKAQSRSYNRATEGLRQPGSCFKVLSTFAPALDSAGYTLATVTQDAPFKYDNGTPVKNHWGNYYKGNMTVRSAIEQSANVVTVKVLTDITPKLGYDYLLKFGFTSIVDKEERDGGIFTDIQQATALGGITHGITNLEITAAYASIANKGTYIKPVLYTKITNRDGEVLIDNESKPEKHEVLKESTAALLTNAMEGVVTSYAGTGRRAALPCGMPVSGKTGTTSDNVDIWFCAYTPYYTCSVWAGYDTNKPLSNTSFHLDIWRKIMNRIHADLPYKDFELSGSIEKKTICTQSGKLAVSGCPAVTEYFASGTIPTDACSGHRSSWSNNDPDDDSNNGSHGNNGGNTTPNSPQQPSDPSSPTPDPPADPNPPVEPDPPVDPNPPANPDQPTTPEG